MIQAHLQQGSSKAGGEIEKNKLQDLLNKAEEEANKDEINDQGKYLADQKIEVLRSLN